MDKDTDIPFGIIQIAGVHDPEETQMLLEEGVDLVGIPLRLTVNAEDLTEPEAAGISRRFPDKCCLITYLDQPGEILDLVRYLGVSWLQLHGSIGLDLLPALKTAMPGLRIIKSLIIGKTSEEELMKEVAAFAPLVTAFITDTYNPGTGAEGATGLSHDWAISRRICEVAACPVILAGGLNHTNVGQAIRATRPWGVDAHTGVEDSTGRKSRKYIREFVRQARIAFGETSRSD